MVLEGKGPQQARQLRKARGHHDCITATGRHKEELPETSRTTGSTLDPTVSQQVSSGKVARFLLWALGPAFSSLPVCERQNGVPVKSQSVHIPKHSLPKADHRFQEISKGQICPKLTPPGVSFCPPTVTTTS